MKYGTIIPLVGGMTIANSLATKEKPSFIISYKPFADNDSSIKKYMPDVPFFTLDNESEFEEFSNSELSKDIDFISAVCPCAGLSLLSTGTQEVKDQKK